MRKTSYVTKAKFEDPRTFTFRMPEAMAEAYVRDRSPQERKMDMGDYLCYVVNEQMGGYYKGKCTEVIIY